MGAMDLIYAFIEALATAAKTVWPGVIGAAIGGYLGLSVLGTIGFAIGAGAGALAGTWIGAKLSLVRMRKMTGSEAGDQLVYAVGALIIVGTAYFLLQFAMMIGAILALAALAFAWIQS